MSDEAKGKIDNLKGRAKEAVGAALGNRKMEAEGAVERAKGAVEEKVGEAKRKLDKGESEVAVDEEKDDEDDEV